MIVKSEMSLSDFKAWSGAVNTKNKIIENGKENEFNDFIEDSYPNGIGETELNDLLWFDDSYIYEMIGINEEE